MTPTPGTLDVEQPTDGAGVPLDDSAIVISGMSGVFPGCHNIMEFAEKIYNKENLVTSKNPRWNCSYPDLPKHHGIIPDLDCFDPQFFMVFHRLSHNMDAITRKLLEHSYQAIFDAGLCPFDLSGKQVGVYIGAGVCESEKACAFAELYLGILGSNRAMFANRISYYLNLKGPSMLVDAENCGSLVALEKAYQAIRSGQCEAALVGVGSLLLHPQTSLLYHKLVNANTDGKTKCYDINADGQSFSEAINVIYLQKSKDAKRIYASIRYVKNNFAASTEETAFQEFGPYRDPAILTKFLKEFYNEAGVSPSMVEYIEGNGAAIPHADKAELEALAEIFCKDREASLAVGSVTSNTGNTGPASGTTSIIKILLGYLNGEMAGTINCENPRQDVATLRDGKIHIASEHHRFGRSFAAVNNFNNTGINVHILLEGVYKPKNLSQYQSEVPYLVTISGRQESSVQKILDDLKGRTLDAEELALLRNIHKQRISKHLARGFAIYTQNEAKALKEKVDYYDDLQKPLWFVYSGMGSQWAGMGVQLMRIPIFAAAIKLCHQVLEQKGIDLINIITNPDKTIFDNILNSFVGIAAIQIGLTDVLRAVGIVPDNIIGHSVGELGCAYADGCLSAEEMILCAYSRGQVSLQTPFIKGSMAAVGLGYKQILNMLPPEIEVACHNGPESSTISGPADAMREFVAKLTEQDIFAKEVPCSNIAYHSRYIAQAGPSLLQHLKEVIKTPRPRSDRWLSTSLPEERWNEPLAKYSSAEYHTNNLLSPVLFHETSRLIPANAVLVEIGPHGLLQAILKRSLPDSCAHIPLTRRGHEDNALFLLEALGQLYINGYQVDVNALYPKVEFPVSTETRPISHLVEWYHADKMKLCQYMSVERKQNNAYKPIVSIYDEEYQFLEGHVISDIKQFPFAGALVFVWDTLAMTTGHPKEHVSVQFNDLTFYAQPPLYDQRPLNLTITLQKGNRKFEVTYEHGIVVEGFITTLAKSIPADNADTNEPLDLTSNDIYKLFYERGFKYTNQFRSIHSANLSLNQAKLVWNKNWVTFIDGAFQLNALKRNHNGISQPQYIKRLCINIAEHVQDMKNCNEDILISGKFDEVQNMTRCGGLLIDHMSFRDKPSIQRQIPALKGMAFFPYFQEENVDILTSLYIFLQIISENLNKTVLNVLYVSKEKQPCLLDKIVDLLADPPKIHINVTKIQKDEISAIKSHPDKPDLIFVHELLSDRKVFEDIYDALPIEKFVVSLGVETEDSYPTSLYQQICAAGVGSDRLELAIWRPDTTPTSAAVSVRNTSDLQFLKYTRDNLLPHQKLLILSSYPPLFGLKDLVKRWRMETNRNKIQVAMVNHEHSKDVDIQTLPNFNLAFNVLNHGQWGGEYYIPLESNNIRGENVELQIAQLGDLESLQWVEANEITGAGIPVMVYFAGLNVYDAKRATVEISVENSQNKGFGMDFSGVTDRGERVMGLISGGAASRRVKVEPELIWPVPKHWSLEDAATVPLAYALAFYCLTFKCRLIRGMSILVHGGAGAVGQAAISIALANGCKVFTTVSDIHKKRFLRRRFPEIPADHIGNSRNVSFRDIVLSATKGNGCDIVISSVKGALKQSSLDCCAASGTTLDLVQIHTQENFAYGMFNMTKSRSYVLIDFYSIFSEKKYEEMKKLQLLISEGIARGYVCPLPRVTYPPEEVSRAIRLLAGSRHRGRVLLRLQESMPVVQPRLNCSPDFCHLIICDKEEFGLLLVERLVRNGARKLFIHYPNQSSYLDFKIELFQKLGAKIQMSTENLSKNDSVATMLKNATRFAPIEGIHVITTGVSTEKSKTKKLSIIANLDSVSREMCPYLRYFVVINGDSSIGQEICFKRARDCLPSLSLQLYDLEKFNESGNHSVLKRENALNAIEDALHSKKHVVLAYAKPVQRRTMLEEIARIPGINISSATSDEITLEQLGIDIGRAQELCNILEKFNISLPKESIPEMTVAELNKKQDQLAEETKVVTGFNGVFNHFEREELLPDFVHMRTRVHTSDIRPDEFDNNLNYLWIVPGVEGHHERFKVLCERLKIPAMVLQPGFDGTDESVPTMAERLLNGMMSRLNVEKHFYLLGYELGVFIALEMAEILEKRGLTGTIYCLGGTQEEIQIALNSELGNLSSNLVQDELLQHMFSVITGTVSENLKGELFQAQNWKEKVKACLKTMRNYTPQTTQYEEALINTVYKRIMMLQSYNLKPLQLKSKIIVLRSKLTTPDSVDTLKGYPQVTIHELDTTLAAAPNNLRCAAIINKSLEIEILQDYRKINRCESSLVNEQMITFSYANY